MNVPGPAQVLELAKVSSTFGEGATAVAALREVDLTIGAGEFVAVMGPSGSGKSSLLALAGGLDRPTSGGVFVESTPLGGLGLNELARLRRRAVGYVFQDFNLVPTLTAAETWRCRWSWTGRPAASAGMRVEADALLVQLSAYPDASETDKVSSALAGITTGLSMDSARRAAGDGQRDGAGRRRALAPACGAADRGAGGRRPGLAVYACGASGVPSGSGDLRPAGREGRDVGA